MNIQVMCCAIGWQIAVSDNESQSTVSELYKFFQAIVPIVLFICLLPIIGLDLANSNRTYFYWELVGVILIVILLPFVPYISTIRFRDTEIDMTDAEWMQDRTKLQDGAVATAEGDEIQRRKQSYDQ